MERQIIKASAQILIFINPPAGRAGSSVRNQRKYRESEFSMTWPGSRYFSLWEKLEKTATNGIRRFLFSGKLIALLTIFLFVSCKQVEKQKTNVPIEEPKKSMAALKEELTDKAFKSLIMWMKKPKTPC